MREKTAVDLGKIDESGWSPEKQKALNDAVARAEKLGVEPKVAREHALVSVAKGLDADAVDMGVALNNGVPPETVLEARGMTPEQGRAALDRYLKVAEGATDNVKRAKAVDDFFNGVKKVTNQLADPEGIRAKAEANPIVGPQGRQPALEPVDRAAWPPEKQQALNDAVARAEKLGVDPEVARESATVSVAKGLDAKAVDMGLAYRNGIPPEQAMKATGMGPFEAQAALDRYLKVAEGGTNGVKRAKAVDAYFEGKVGPPTIEDPQGIKANEDAIAEARAEADAREAAAAAAAKADPNEALHGLLDEIEAENATKNNPSSSAIKAPEPVQAGPKDVTGRVPVGPETPAGGASPDTKALNPEAGAETPAGGASTDTKTPPKVEAGAKTPEGGDPGNAAGVGGEKPTARETPEEVIERLGNKPNRTEAEEVQLIGARQAVRDQNDVPANQERAADLAWRQNQARRFDVPSGAPGDRPMGNINSGTRPRRQLVEGDTPYLENIMDGTGYRTAQNSVSASIVNKNVEEMLPGGWQPEPGEPPIRIGPDGTLGNGHHRMIAATIVSKLTGRPIMGGPDAILPEGSYQFGPTEMVGGGWDGVRVDP